MFKFIKKNDKKSAIIFVVLSLLAFFFLFFIVTITISNFLQSKYNTVSSVEENESSKIIDKSADPFIFYPVLESDLEKINTPTVSDNNPIYGNKSVETNIVYFSDYDCKYCYSQVEILQALVNNYPDRVNLVWKDYPELDYESLSFKAAVSARCAQRQGKFWEFQEAFYSQFDIFKLENGNSHEALDNFIFGIAKGLELREKDFKACYNNLETKTLILEDVAEAQKLQIIGVPFTYVGDKEMLGEYNIEDIEFLLKNN